MNRKEYTLPNDKKAVFEYDVNEIGKVSLECMDMLMEMIADRASIDIVHCRDCKYWRTDEKVRCRLLPYADANDFCSYGERIEE